MHKIGMNLLLLLAILLSSLALPRPALAYSQEIYADALGTGWADWSWAQVNLAATAPVHSGTRSLALSVDAWEGLQLHKPGIDTLGLTQLRFFIHGGGSGGQRLNVVFYLTVNGADQQGPAVAVPPPAANAWQEVRLPLSALNPTGAEISGIVWQDASGHTQPTLYLDDIALINDESPAGPQLSLGKLFPRSVPADGHTPLTVRVSVSDPQGLADVAAVTLDAASLGAGLVALRDDGRSNDGLAGDGVFGAALTLAPGTASGERRMLVTASDQAGHTAGLPLGALEVLAAPGGSIPAALPQRLGWGSNAWSETAGQDWQVNSGVPWDYVYQYITYNWESWGGSFVSRFVHQAWNKHYIPMVTVYMVLGTPPDCGESSTCYAQKLQNAGMVQTYLASLQRAAQEAKGSQPVIFNLEPDFYGYMQQLSNSDNRPAGVRPNDPSSYPVALNLPGYPNTLAGFGRRLVDVVHASAPNALVAPMASMWATNLDPHNVTDSQAIAMARSTAAFIDAMGGAQADLLIAEWSDRDAGFGLRPWWDDTDMELPRPTRAILWENALSQTAKKRILLWQIPVGNMSLNNTCDHYRDNRAAYLFSHPRDLVDAGVIGVLFGGGTSCMTGVDTDGGFVAAQGAIAYANPATPTGLSAGSPAGVLAPLRWNESSEPDLWGYRVTYRKLPNGPQFSLAAGRRNSLRLVLPTAGTWEIRLAAVDAIGKESALTPAVQVTTTEDALQVFLPRLSR